MTPLPKKATSDTTDVATSYLSDDSLSPYSNQNNTNVYSTSFSSTVSNSSTCSIYASKCIHSGIRELDISCNPIGDEGGVLIGEALKYNTSIREINLDNTDIGDDTIISICKSIGSTIPPMTQNEDPSDSPPRCARLQHISRLLKLSANKNHIGPKGCEALGILLEKNPRICSLSLEHNYFGDEGVKKIVQYLKIQKSSSPQTSTSTSTSNPNSPSFTAVTGIPIINKDHHIHRGSNRSSYSSTSSNGNGWSVFGTNLLDGKDMDGNKRNSGIGNYSASDVGGSYLDGSTLNFNTLSSNNHNSKNTHLSSLYLSANNITMKGFIELIQSCPSLKLLDLHKNYIRLTEKDDFSKVIKKFGLNKLQELYLSDNNMGVTDLKLICNMLHSGLTPKLEELSLTGNVSLYDDEAYEEWEERINQLELERHGLSNSN